MVLPSLDSYREKVQAHFNHHRGNYCFIGVLSVTSYTVYSKWGNVAVITFVMTGIGVYSYARSKIQQVCQLACESKLSALFPLVTSLIAVVFPAVGVFLGAISSGIESWKNHQMNEAVNQAQGQVQELSLQNQKLGNLVEDMKLKLEGLQGLVDRCLAMSGNIEEVAQEHTDTQKTIQPIEQGLNEQMSQLEAKIHQLISIQDLLSSPGQLPPQNFGEQLERIVEGVDQHQSALTVNQQNLRNLIAQAERALSLYSSDFRNQTTQ